MSEPLLGDPHRGLGPLFLSLSVRVSLRPCLDSRGRPPGSPRTWEGRNRCTSVTEKTSPWGSGRGCRVEGPGRRFEDGVPGGGSGRRVGIGGPERRKRDVGSVLDGGGVLRGEVPVRDPRPGRVPRSVSSRGGTRWTLYQGGPPSGKLLIHRNSVGELSGRQVGTPL